MKRHGQAPRREFRPSQFDGAASLGSCPDCGKSMFISRPAAKHAARRALQEGIEVTRAYRCGSGYWHLTSQDADTVAAHRERA